MPCYRPLPAAVLLANKHQLPHPMPEFLPCGKCLGCRKQQARDWSTRMYHESQLHNDACFLTLTYGDEDLPSDLSLNKKHPTDFLKRLRHHAPTFRYYSVGEYGDENKRPHYHAIVFGFAFPDRTPWMRNSTAPLYRSDLLERNWGHGYATVQDVTTASIRYVARYVNKKLGQIHNYERFDSITGEVWSVKPEYALMSRRPGIAHHWIERFWHEVYPSDFTVVDGAKAKPPHYYDRWMAADHKPEDQKIPCIDCKEHQEIYLEVQTKRRDWREDQSAEYGNSYKCLEAGEVIAIARETQSKRNL